jgi:hypothetical protein
MSGLGRLQPLPIVRKTAVNLAIQANLDLGSKNCKKTHQENLHQVVERPLAFLTPYCQQA